MVDGCNREDGGCRDRSVPELIDTAWEYVSHAQLALARRDLASAVEHTKTAAVGAARALVAARGLPNVPVSNLGAARAASEALLGGLAGDIVSSVERLGALGLLPSGECRERDLTEAHEAIMSLREYVALIESEVSR